MLDTITLTGIVATDPRHVVTPEGLAITTFRLASGQRRFDRTSTSWVDADTNWYTVSAFRVLAVNVAHSVQKGQHVMVTGKLRVREWTSGDRSGTAVEVAAESLGHDLNWYTTTAIRTGLTAQSPPNSGVGRAPGAGAIAGAGAVSEGETGGLLLGAEHTFTAGIRAETGGTGNVNEEPKPEAAPSRRTSTPVPVDF